MPSELYMLARKLDHISEQNRASRDFTLRSLEAALAEVIACFPVYRSYIGPNQASIDDEDRRLITNSIAVAKRHNPATDVSVFDFIGSFCCSRTLRAQPKSSGQSVANLSCGSSNSQDRWLPKASKIRRSIAITRLSLFVRLAVIRHALGFHPESISCTQQRAPLEMAGYIACNINSRHETQRGYSREDQCALRNTVAVVSRDSSMGVVQLRKETPH